MERTAILLASASPRRRRLLAWLVEDYRTLSTDTAEDLSSPLAAEPAALARSLAEDKARAARSMTPGADLILAFDTIVVIDGRVLGKPGDVADARAMLETLSGRVHEVVTGVAVLDAGQGEPESFAVATPVMMRDLDHAALSEWLSGDEVLGCAGAYNIERYLATVEAGECYQNVAGLPLCHLYGFLVRLGVPRLTPPCHACESARGVECVLGRSLCGGEPDAQT